MSIETRVDLDRQTVEALLYACEVCRRSLLRARDSGVLNHEETIAKLGPMGITDKILEQALERITESEAACK